MKQVPDADEIRIDPDTGRLKRSEARAVMNAPDYNGVEAALEVKDSAGGEVIAITMGPPDADEVLQEAVAMGCDDGVLLTDRAFAGSDTWPTSLALAEAARELDADVVVCGEETTDSSTGQVPPGIAAHNDWAQLTYVEDLEPKPEEDELHGVRDVEGGSETVAASPPVVVAYGYGENTPRTAPLHRKIYAENDFEAHQMTAEDLGIEDEVGLPNSPTAVGGQETIQEADRKKENVEDTEELVATLQEHGVV